eukprot:c23084_g1_i2 orf=173-1279(+)
MYIRSVWSFVVVCCSTNIHTHLEEGRLTTMKHSSVLPLTFLSAASTLQEDITPLSFSLSCSWLYSSAYTASLAWQPSPGKFKPNVLVRACIQSSTRNAAITRRVRALSSKTSVPSQEYEEYEEYEVELEKPVGLKFYKGSDGGTYIDAIAQGGNADKTKMFTPGDKVLSTSAVFGTEMWPAAEYGRTMYSIRQRVGTVALRMQKRYGREDAAVPRDLVAAERNSGVVGDAVREIQMKNYMWRMELKRQRENDFNEGLDLYNVGKYEAALQKFESVLGLKPGVREAAVSSYNVACCYSKLNQVEAGLSALEDAMQAGFENYSMIKADPGLVNLRASTEFKSLMNKYDEPFIDENTISALKGLFGIFRKI